MGLREAESPDERGQTRVHILRDVEKFLRNSDMPATRFGRQAVRDPRFVFDLRRGREPRPSTIEKVRAFLEECQ